MELKDWLEAEGERGRQSALAVHCKVSPAAVSQWKDDGVPVTQMEAVRDFTDAAVSIEAMVKHAAEARKRTAKAA